MAGAPGAQARRLSRVALRDHAAADDRQGGHPLLRELPGALADGGDAGGGDARRRLGRVGGTRLLQPRAQSAQVRADRVQRVGGPFSGHGRRPARAAGHRALHGSSHRRHRFRRGHDAGRRQHRACRGPAFRREDTAAGGQARDQAARPRPDAGQARRRFRAGADGPRRQRVQPEAPLVSDVPAAGRMRRPLARDRSCAAGASGKAGASHARRDRLSGLARGRARPAAAPAGGRPARRHAGGALDRVGRDAAAHRRGPARHSGARRLVGAAGRGCPHLHALPSRRRWSIAPSCRLTPRSPSGPTRSAASGSPAATSTAPPSPP